jgi:hypothetical protein
MIMEYLSKQGRYRVRPLEPIGLLPPSLVVKPQNLKPASSHPTSQPEAVQVGTSETMYPPSSIFILKGLRAQSSFNGNVVKIVKYLPDQDRYRVSPVEARSMMPVALDVKPHNLAPVPLAVSMTETKQLDRRSSLQSRKDESKPKLTTRKPAIELERPSSMQKVTARLTKQRSHRSLPSASKQASMQNPMLTPAKKQTRERTLVVVSKWSSKSDSALLTRKNYIDREFLVTGVTASSNNQKSNSELLTAIDDIERDFLVTVGVTASSNNQKSDSELLMAIDGIERDFLVAGVKASSNNQKIQRNLVTVKKQTSQRTMAVASKALNGETVSIAKCLEDDIRNRVKPDPPTTMDAMLTPVKKQTRERTLVGVSKWSSKSDSELLTRKNCLDREFLVTGVTASSNNQKIRRTSVTVKKQTRQRTLVLASKGSKALNGETVTIAKYLEDDTRNHVNTDAATTMAVQLKISTITSGTRLPAMPEKPSGQRSSFMSLRPLENEFPGVGCQIKPIECLTSSRSHPSLTNIVGVSLTTSLSSNEEKLRSASDVLPSATRQKRRSNKKKNESRPPENWGTSDSNRDFEPYVTDDGCSIDSMNGLYAPLLRPSHVSKMKIISTTKFRTTKNKEVSSDATVTTHNSMTTAASS